MAASKSTERGLDIAEFATGELRIVGGDYGQIVIEGATYEARLTFDAIIDRIRSGSDVASVSLVIALRDRSPIVVEDRHAGRERTPEAGVASIENAERESGGAKSVPAKDAGKR